MSENQEMRTKEEVELQKLAGRIAVVMIVGGIFAIPLAALLGLALRVFAWSARL